MNRYELVGFESDKFIRQNRPPKESESAINSPLKRRFYGLTEVHRLGKLSGFAISSLSDVLVRQAAGSTLIQLTFAALMRHHIG